MEQHEDGDLPDAPMRYTGSWRVGLAGGRCPYRVDDAPDAGPTAAELAGEVELHERHAAHLAEDAG